MLDIPSISAIVAATGVIVGVFLSYLEIRNLVRQRETDVETRQAQLFMELYDHYYSKDVMKDENEVIFQWEWKDFKDFWRKYGPETNIEAFSKWDSLETYIKGVGVLVKRKMIDPDLVKDLMGTSIILHWEKFGPVTKEIRRHYWPHAYEWYEYFYNEMKKREQQLAKAH